MIKAILFDGDGVVINKPMQFSECFEKDFNVPISEMLLFFKNEFQLCLTGKADLKEVIKPYLSKWNWEKSVDDLLDYWFKSENYIDSRVIDLIEKCHSKNIKCYIHSNQEKYRTDYMKETMGLNKVVDGMFSSAYLGVKKPEQEFWQKIFDEIQPALKEEVLVLDDDEENIISAKKFGFNAESYKDFDKLQEDFKKYIN